MSNRDNAAPSRRRSIGWRINGAVFIVAGLLITVSALSIYVFYSYRELLTQLAETSLPELSEGAEVSARLGGLLLLTERLSAADSEPLRRIALRELNENFDSVTIAAGQISSPATRTQVMQQLENLGKSITELDRVVTVKLASEAAITQSLKALDDVIADVTEQAVTKAGTNATWIAALARLRAEVHAIAHQQRTVDRRRARQDFAATMARLKDVAKAQADTAATIAVTELESLILGKGGIAERLEEDLRSGISSRAQGNLVRGVVDDLNAAFAGRFIENNREVSQGAEDLLRRLMLQVRFLTAVIVIALLVGAGVQFYIRQTVTRRLLRIEEEVRARVEGSEEEIDEEGSDEVAAIARAINYFARELRLARDEAQASNEAKSRFLANVSHEVRTPLNTVIGMSYLANQHNTNNRVSNYLHQIESAGTHLLHVINDILEISRAEAGRIELDNRQFRLTELVTNVCAMLQNQADDAGIELHHTLPDSLDTVVVGDPLRLQQVLLNLLGNGIKFTPEGSVGIVGRELARNASHLSFELDVVDTGIGIKPETQDVLFQSFEQGDSSVTRRYGGSGLGLAISRSLVELMGGELSLASVDGQGSTFTLRLQLPIATADAAVPTEAQTESRRNWNLTAPTHGCPPRVLIAEDQDVNRLMMREIVEGFGAEALEAENGAQVLTLLDDNTSPAPDLILMDVQMPVLDGVAATQQLRERWSPAELPVIGLSAHAGIVDRERCLEVGMNDYLTKPVNVDELGGLLAALGAPGRADTPAAPTPTASPPDTAPLLDVEVALHRCNDNAPLLDTLLERLTEQIDALLLLLPTDDATPEVETLQHEVHSLRGVAANLAAVPLATALTEADTTLRRGEALAATQLLLIENLARSTQQAISKARDSLTTPQAPTSTGAQRLDPKLLISLRDRLRNRDLAARELFGTLRAALAEAMESDTFAALESALTRLDFAGALTALEQLDATAMESDADP